MLGAPLAVGTEARRSSLMGNSTLPAYREHLTRIESLRRKQDKPVTFPTKGRNAVRRIDSVAGMRKEKKRRPRGNGVDTGCVSHIDNITGRESGQTFPWSFTRENLRNRLTRQCK